MHVLKSAINRNKRPIPGGKNRAPFVLEKNETI